MKLGIFDKYKTVLSQTEHIKKFYIKSFKK